MRIDWISQLAVLLLCRNDVIDQLLVSAVLVEFGGAFFQACATPEGLTNIPGLVNNLLLFDELCEADIEGTDRHGAKNEKNSSGDSTALLESFHKNVGVLTGRRACCCCKVAEHFRELYSKNRKSEWNGLPLSREPFTKNHLGNRQTT